jgi:DNA repair exonuclease SbcCD ATPase subunit
MELIDRINGLEKELDMVKSEIKQVLVDLRETMNMAENPFAHLEELQQGGTRGVDETRIKRLEDSIEQLKSLSEGNHSVDETRLKSLEDAIEQLKSQSEGNSTVDETRLKSLEDAIEQLKSQSEGNHSVDETRLKSLELSFEQLRDMSGSNTVDETRLKSLEDAIEQLKSQSEGNHSVDETRLKSLEDAIEQLKVIGMNNEDDGEILKNLENSMQDLENQGNIEVETLKKLEAAIEVLGETKTQSPSGLPLFHNRGTSESERSSIIAGLGEKFADETWDGIIDPLMLAQIIQWADYALNLIGLEQLNYVIDLYELTGRLSREMKDAILKVMELPAAYLTTKNEEVEAKHCIIALFELDRIITGEHQELFTLLRDMS